MAPEEQKPPQAARRPVLPAAPAPGGEDVPPAEAVAELRRFHLAGPLDEDAETVGEQGLLPALLAPFRDPSKVRSDYPLYLPPVDDDPENVRCVPVGEFLARTVPEGDSARILRDNVLRLERRVRRALAGASDPLDARAVLEGTVRGLSAELKLSAGDSEVLQSSLDAFMDAVPDGARFVPWSEHAPLTLLEQAARSRLRPRRAAFAAEVKRLVGELRALLEVDRRKRPESREAGSLDGAMGDSGSRYIDTSALSGTLGIPRGSLAMSPPRRKRVEHALAALESYAAESEPPLRLVHDGSLAKAQSLEGWQSVKHADPCLEAAERFDEQAAWLADTLKAVRTARLELKDAYDPARHDPWLAQFDWEAMDLDELLLLSPVVALVSARHVAAEGMLSVSRLILSGRPVQILITVNPAENPAAGKVVHADAPATHLEDPLDGYRFEPGYLGMSHREALVNETSNARPLHMMEGFMRAVRASHPALHVVASGDGLGAGEPLLGPWLYAGAAVEGRAHPLFRYDPEAGATWARRLDFSENPSPESDWPAYELAATEEGGGETMMSLPFTFADFALLEPAYSAHFRPVSADIGDDVLAPLADWLHLPAEDAASKVPFIWAVDATDRMTRLAVTRRLALAARDRLDYWRTLQELAGVRSEYIDEAVKRAREEAEARAAAEIEALKDQHAAELEDARRNAAEDVADRLTAALMGADVSLVLGAGAPAAKPAPVAAPAEASEPEAPAVEAAPEPAPAEEEPMALEAYIDTDLCTTCNECTNLNPQMFVYNADKKAYIADAKAGTFAQLVQAAEKCPARIIHPGAPLNPDEPGLDELVQRAAKFN
jgi:ferredoxin